MWFVLQFLLRVTISPACPKFFQRPTTASSSQWTNESRRGINIIRHKREARNIGRESVVHLNLWMGFKQLFSIREWDPYVFDPWKFGPHTLLQKEDYTCHMVVTNKKQGKIGSLALVLT